LLYSYVRVREYSSSMLITAFAPPPLSVCKLDCSGTQYSFWNSVGFVGDACCGLVVRYSLPVFALDRTDTCLVLEGDADRSGGQRLRGDGEGGRGI
jgi:hypothetical protein